jgi:hypothetical protein
MVSEGALALELAGLEGGPPAARIVWDLESLRGLVAGELGPEAEARSPWRLEREPDWKLADTLRVISAAFEEETLLAVAMLRPRGAQGHDADALAAALVPAEAEEKQLHEVLVSTEYGPDGAARRLGLELYEDPEGPPMRIAADREGTVEVGGGGARHELTAMSFTMDGKRGAGLHELIRSN